MREVYLLQRCGPCIRRQPGIQSYGTARVYCYPVNNPAEEWKWALSKSGFKRLSDGEAVDITKLPEDGKDQLYYIVEPYTTKKLHRD